MARPIRLSKKEWASVVVGSCLAIASILPGDPYVFNPMLFISWLAFLYLAYYHEGSKTFRTLFSVAVTGVLLFIAVRKSQHQSEHEPLVIHNKPPVFVQPFTCEAKGTLHTGNMQLYAANFGDAIADRVNQESFEIRVIPEHKTGVRSIDQIPAGRCTTDWKDNSGRFTNSLAQGQEQRVDVRQNIMAFPALKEGEPVQLYLAECVHYVDPQGNGHTTCDTYRLFLPSTNPLDAESGSPTFVCDGNPKMGIFQEAFTGHCHK